MILLMSDQHRANLMTCNGNDLVPTLNVDRIAEKGVRFKRVCCPYPVYSLNGMGLFEFLKRRVVF